MSAEMCSILHALEYDQISPLKKKKSSVGLHDQEMLNSLYLMLLLNCFSTQTLLHLQTGYCLTLCVQYEQLVHNSSLKMNEK